MIKKTNAFTLIELIVVVAIIGILATVVIMNVVGARARSRDSRRATDILTIKKAVEGYHIDNNYYPPTPVDCSLKYSSSNVEYYATDADCLTDTYIVGISDYLPQLPTDPGPVKLTDGKNGRGYMYYASNSASGSDYYKIMAHHPEDCANSTYSNIVDPKRICWAWSYYAPESVGATH